MHHQLLFKHRLRQLGGAATARNLLGDEEQTGTFEMQGLQFCCQLFCSICLTQIYCEVFEIVVGLLQTHLPPGTYGLQVWEVDVAVSIASDQRHNKAGMQNVAQH